MLAFFLSLKFLLLVALMYIYYYIIWMHNELLTHYCYWILNIVLDIVSSIIILPSFCISLDTSLHEFLGAKFLGQRL